MKPLLQPNQVLSTEYLGAPVVVEEFVARGGQGEVYAFTLGGERMALKWYFPEWIELDTGLRERLNTAIRMGAPNDSFVWPIDIATIPGHAGFGYVMRFIESRFRNWDAIRAGTIEPSFKKLAFACREVASGYQALHAKGLCYHDINFDNVFLDPDSGEILICDNDNVDVNGVRGKMGGQRLFMAPEIVRAFATRSGACAPTAKTDLWSLAVLFYYAFFQEHPLIDGSRCPQMLDGAAFVKLTGFDPRFVFDRPTAPDGNKPFKLAAEHWNLYPNFFRAMFMQAFTDGIHDPVHGRVSESEWRRGMMRLHDSIAPCSECGAENFFEPAATSPHCWSCSRALAEIRVLMFGENPVVLSEGAQLFPHPIDPRRSFDFTQTVADVIRNPQRADLVGLRNLGAEPWKVVLANGQERIAKCGQTVGLQSGVRIAFGRSQGIVS